MGQGIFVIVHHDNTHHDYHDNNHDSGDNHRHANDNNYNAQPSLLVAGVGRGREECSMLTAIKEAARRSASSSSSLGPGRPSAGWA